EVQSGYSPYADNYSVNAAGVGQIDNVVKISGGISVHCKHRGVQPAQPGPERRPVRPVPPGDVAHDNSPGYGELAADIKIAGRINCGRVNRLVQPRADG